MHQEPADKLITMQPHDLLLIIPIVLVSEPNLILLLIDNTLIADRNTVRISRQISDDTLHAVQTVLAIHHPVFLHQLIEHTVNFTGVGDATELALICLTTQRTDQIAPEVTRYGNRGQITIYCNIRIFCDLTPIFTVIDILRLGRQEVVFFPFDRFQCEKIS